MVEHRDFKKVKVRDETFEYAKNIEEVRAERDGNFLILKILAFIVISVCIFFVLTWLFLHWVIGD